MSFYESVNEWQSLATKALTAAQAIALLEEEMREWTRIEIQALIGTSIAGTERSYTETSAEKEVKNSETYRDYKRKIMRLRGEQGEAQIEADALYLKLEYSIYKARTLKRA